MSEGTGANDAMNRAMVISGSACVAVLVAGVVIRLTEAPNHLVALAVGVVLLDLVWLPLFLIARLREPARARARLGHVVGFVAAFVVAPAFLYGRILAAQPPLLLAAGALVAALIYAWRTLRAEPAGVRKRSLRRQLSSYGVILVVLGLNTPVSLQLPDRSYRPAITSPEYARGQGPVVFIDEGHHNFHTVDGRFWGFAELLRTDGYQLEPYQGVFEAPRLARGRILVIANAIHESNLDRWSLPTPSAFTQEEIRVVVHWVRDGGSLLLIADHMPFPGAAQDLARAFGFALDNGFAMPEALKRAPGSRCDEFSGAAGTLRAHPVTAGRSPAERVDRVCSFVGSAFSLPQGAAPLLVFGPSYVQLLTETAWQFDGVEPQPIEGFSQGALVEVGAGKVAVFGEAAMFTTQLAAGLSWRRFGMNAPEASQNYRLVLNLIHWLDGRL